MKVAIFGHGQWRQDVLNPLREQGFEIWGLNDPGYNGLKPAMADRWFQLHRLDYLEANWPRWVNEGRDTWLAHWACGGKTPLYMPEAYLSLPGTVRFPKDEIEAKFKRGAYHCGSFDWMVAAALLWGAEAILLYGISLTGGGEPLSARACLEYWLGMAEGMGVDVDVDATDLFWTFQLLRSKRQYGWDESRPIVDLEC